MKRLIWLILLLALLLPSGALALMGDYCSAPPYVTRSIAPNIMVLMDNSQAMYGAAYSGAYSPNAQNDNYIGYFVPSSCYSYNGNKFTEELKNNVACTAAAPYRGNLMNWATMSKYDVLQKVLIGGNSTSKQGNANTLVSIGGAFTPDKVHEGCIFRVSSANLTITEANSGDCRLLNNPAEIIAAQPRRAIPSIGDLIALFSAPSATDWSHIAATQQLPHPTPIPAKTSVTPRSAMETAIAAVGGVVPSAELANIWDEIALVSKARAVDVCPLPTLDSSYSIAATIGVPYAIRLNSYDAISTNTVTWTTTAKPAWLNPTSYVNTSKTTNYGIIYSGTPTAAGEEILTVSYSSSKCDPDQSKDFTIYISTAALQIDQPNSALPTGMVGVPYNYSTTVGHGGVPPRSWSVSPLPAGLTAAAATGYITGTPTTTFNSNVTFTLSDSAASTSATRTVNLTIAASDLSIVTSFRLPRAALNEVYTPFQLEATGGSGAPYTWAISSGAFPAGITMTAGGLISGTPTVDVDTSALVLRVTDDNGNSITKTFEFTVDAIAALPTMTSRLQPLAAAAKGELFTFQLQASGGSPYSPPASPYDWTQVSTDDPALTVSAGGLITWNIPNSQAEGSYNITVSMRDSNGTQATHVVAGDTTPTHRIDVVRSLSPRSSSFNVNVELIEDGLTDLNGNGIWDLGEAFTEENGVAGWQGKQGLFQKFWDSNIPKARWGMTKFGSSGPNIATCIPASPVGSWYTNIQNATPSATSPLATGLNNAIKYFDFNGGFSGCTNSDPIDLLVPCRKNFILVISSGSVVTGDALDAGSTGCTQSDALVKNACVGFKSDLRTETGATGKQNVYTYMVNTMGTTNSSVLQAAATAGGGKYYDASDAATLETQLTQALQDILSQAASGTAVSVLTTSSRGIGSMVQAYFLPVRTDGTRDVSWTGYTQDLWIDPQDNLREDTVQDLKLKPTEDKVVKLFFDTSTNETRVARFTTDVEGSGGTLASCTAGDIEPFSATKYLWEAGQKLALKAANDRNLMTSKKVIHGETVTNTFANPTFTTANVTGTPALLAALNAATAETPVYTATEIVDYVRGVDKETADPSRFRDRRLAVSSPTDLHVWKLGDIISSTPKVFANTPANTYHIDYGDSTYYSYVTSATYKERSSVAFVGANDGVMHAFRVGYLKDTGLTAGVKGLFKNAINVDDTVNNTIGQEMWGFIPFNAFPYLKYLANPGYCHIYFNDLSVRIVDASVGAVGVATDPTAAKATASWRSILIGGMRFGGACAGSTAPAPPIAGVDVGYSAYYAIDITDPENPVPLWEFSDPGLGYATTFPSIVRTGNKNTNGSWYVALGSGSTQMPKSSTDMARSTTGYVYLLDLKTGTLVKKVELGHNAIVSDIVAVDSQKDANVDTLYFGTSYPTPAATTPWGGKLMSLNVAGNVPELCGTGVTRTAANCDTNQKIIFDGAFPFTASPDIARDPSGNVWIYAGAGKYVSDIDEADHSDQIFLGIKAKLADGTSYPTIQIGVTATTDFIDRSAVTTTGTVTSKREECLYNPAGSGATQFSLQWVVTGIAPTSTAVTIPPQGWYLILTAGERVISRPLAVGGLVDFLTYKPDNDLCSYGGSSYLYAVDYQKGIAPTNVAIRAPATTNNVTTGAVTINKGILLGPGAPPTGEAITIPPPKEGQEQLKKKIQVATGVIVEAENTPVISTISKVVHWLKK